MTTPHRIAVIIGSTRPKRFSERPARWIAQQLKKRSEFDVDLVDLRDFPLPFFDEPTAPARTPRSYRTPEIERWGKRIDAAAGYVWLSPEYNHGYSGVLKNAIDHLYVEWHHKPVTFVGWGGAGGARAIEQLRAVSVELEMAPLRHAVHVPFAVMLEAMNNPNISDEELFRSLEPKATLLANDLAWWTEALAAAREQDARAAAK